MKVLINLAILIVIALAVIVLVVVPWPALAAVLVLFGAWMGLTRSGRQARSAARVGIATIPQRLGAAAVVVVGIAGVVGVLVAMLAMAEGFRQTLQQTGDVQTAIVLRGGATAELSSSVMRDEATLIQQLPGIARDTDDRPIMSPELVVVANVPKKSSGTDANLEIRGVGEQAFVLRPNVSIVAGRSFQPGLRELIVGKGALAQFTGLEPGSTLSLANQDWAIVGVFESNDAHESEVWGDVETVSTTYRRQGYQSVTVRLASPQTLDQFKAAIASDPRLKVEAKTTLDYYTAQSEDLTRMIRIIGIVIGAIMALGAVFGALNTMYAAVATRAREIATLRAIGFRGLPVAVSVLLETMLLALGGGILGALVAWLLFNNYTVSTLGSNFSQVVFAFKVSPVLVWDGLKWALAIGFAGGVFPAVRAARLPVTTALREL